LLARKGNEKGLSRKGKWVRVKVEVKVDEENILS
jgi:hypothetical protein